MTLRTAHRKITPELLAEIHSAIPLAPLPGIDYYELRGLVPFGFVTIRKALQIMIDAECIKEVNGGLRGRKSFQRIGELPASLLAPKIEPAPFATPVLLAHEAIPASRRQPLTVVPPWKPLAGANYPRLAVPKWKPTIPTGSNIRNVYEGQLPAMIAAVIGQMTPTQAEEK